MKNADSAMNLFLINCFGVFHNAHSIPGHNFVITLRETRNAKSYIFIGVHKIGILITCMFIFLLFERLLGSPGNHNFFFLFF